MKDKFHVNGNAVLHIENDTFPILVEGNLDKCALKNDDAIFYVPLFGSIKNKKSEEQCILGLYLDSNKDTAVTSLSMGTISSETPGLIQFGETHSDFQYVLNLLQNKDVP